jgi:methionyl-tRNA formyltransferase
MLQCSHNMKLKIVFFGTPFFVVPVLEALIEDFDVVGIATTPDVHIGRKKILTGTPVKLAFQKYLEQTGKKGLIITTPKFTKETLHKVEDLQPDLFVVAAYGHLIPKALLKIPKYGSINIHPSLLPKYRGPSPIQTTILKGDKKAGVTIIKMDEEIDHGPILIKEELPISIHDTFETLHVKLFIFASEMLQRIIPQYVSGTLKPKPQAHAKATYCDHITRQDGYFSIDNPPDKALLDRMIRAYYPWPTAWTRVRIKNSHSAKASRDKHESRIMKFLPGKLVQLEGGRATPLKEFLNGHPELKESLTKILNT